MPLAADFVAPDDFADVPEALFADVLLLDPADFFAPEPPSPSTLTSMPWSASDRSTALRRLAATPALDIASATCSPLTLPEV